MQQARRHERCEEQEHILLLRILFVAIAKVCVCDLEGLKSVPRGIWWEGERLAETRVLQILVQRGLVC
jgi:hypothetical protein